MLRTLKNLLRRPSLRFGMERDSQSKLRDPGFISYMSQGSSKRLDTDARDRALRGRKLIRQVFAVGLAGGCAWVVLESAKALSVF